MPRPVEKGNIRAGCGRNGQGSDVSMTLPNAERAIVELAKLSDYCLSTTHPVGRHKATVFRAALGLTAVNAPQLSEMIRLGVRDQPAALGKADEFGQRCQVDLPLATDMGAAVVRTAWIIRTGEEVPRLVTCYVLGD